jgi:DNA-binding transcriptional ArsR family regulator
MSVDLDATAETVLKALAEPMRWRIVRLLAAEELCVCHLVESLGIPQPLVSHHLRVLRDAGLVETERHRYWTYYRVRPGTMRAVAGEIETLAHRTPRAGERRRPCC